MSHQLIFVCWWNSLIWNTHLCLILSSFEEFSYSTRHHLSICLGSSLLNVPLPFSHSSSGQSFLPPDFPSPALPPLMSFHNLQTMLLLSIEGTTWKLPLPIPPTVHFSVPFDTKPSKHVLSSLPSPFSHLIFISFRPHHSTAAVLVKSPVTPTCC